MLSTKRNTNYTNVVGDDALTALVVFVAKSACRVRDSNNFHNTENLQLSATKRVATKTTFGEQRAFVRLTPDGALKPVQGGDHTGISLQALWISSNAPGFTDPLKREKMPSQKWPQNPHKNMGTPQSNWIQKAGCNEATCARKRKARNPEHADVQRYQNHVHTYIRREHGVDKSHARK